jgi:16S rRNA U1498 N3-methylase RsmE
VACVEVIRLLFRGLILDVTKMDITLQGEVVRIQGDEFWHMTRVLRLGVNDRYHCFSSSVEYAPGLAST